MSASLGGALAFADPKYLAGAGGSQVVGPARQRRRQPEDLSAGICGDLRVHTVQPVFRGAVSPPVAHAIALGDCRVETSNTSLSGTGALSVAHSEPTPPRHPISNHSEDAQCTEVARDGEGRLSGDEPQMAVRADGERCAAGLPLRDPRGGRKFALSRASRGTRCRASSVTWRFVSTASPCRTLVSPDRVKRSICTGAARA